MNERIKRARVSAGFSQKQVALTLHVSGPTVSEWESGRKTPSTENLIALAELFEVSVDYLIGRFSRNSYLDDLSHKNICIWLSSSRKKEIYHLLSSACDSKSIPLDLAIVNSGIKFNFLPQLSNGKDGPCPFFDILCVADHLATQGAVYDLMVSPDSVDLDPELSAEEIDILENASSQIYMKQVQSSRRLDGVLLKKSLSDEQVAAQEDPFYRHRIAYANAPVLIKRAVHAVLDALLDGYSPAAIAARAKKDAAVDKSGVDLNAAPDEDFTPSGNDIP